MHKLLRNLEIGTQFVDLEFAQRNLEIVQIPKMHGRYTQSVSITVHEASLFSPFTLTVLLPLSPSL